MNVYVISIDVARSHDMYVTDIEECNSKNKLSKLAIESGAVNNAWGIMSPEEFCNSFNYDMQEDYCPEKVYVKML